MSSEIIKSIVLKFRGDTKDVEKSVKSMTDALNKLEKGGASAGSNRLAKSFQDFSKSATQAGVVVGKEFTKLQKVIQQIAKTDLQQIGKQTEQLAVKAERRLKRFQDMEKSGAAGPKVDRARALATGTSDKLEAFMDLFNQRAQGIGGAGGGGGQQGGGGGLAGMFGGGPTGQFLASMMGAGAIASAPSKIADFAMERHRQALVNPAIASNLEIQQRLAGYAGNAEMSILARKGSVDRAKQYGEQKQFWGKAKDYGTLGVGALLLGGGAALSMTGVGATLGVPAMAMGGAMVAGAGAIAYGGAGAADRIFNNKNEREKAQGFTEAISAEKERLIDPFLYGKFRETSRTRANLQQQFGISTKEAFDLRVKGLGEQMSPEEQQAVMQSFKPMGARNAGKLSIIAGREAIGQEMDLGTSSQLTQSMAMSGKGTGPLNAQKNMEEMFRRAVAGGVTDAGVREQLEKTTAAIMDSSSSRMDAGTLMQSLIQYLPAAGPGGEMDPRAIQAASDAMKLREQDFQGNAPIDKALKRSSVMQALPAGERNMPNIDYVNSLTREQVLQGTPELKMMGIDTPEKQKKLADSIENASGNVNPQERAARASIEATQKAGGTVTDEQLMRLSVAHGSAQGGSDRLRNTTHEAGMAEARGLMGVTAGTAAGEAAVLSPMQQTQKVQDYLTTKKNREFFSAEIDQKKFEIEGQTGLEKDIYKSINPNLSADIDQQRAANKETKHAGEETDPGKSATGAIAAMDRFAAALDGLSAKIGRASPGD